MYSYYTISDELRERLVALEQELERPIRLLPVSRGDISDWGSGYFNDTEFTVEVAQERGITMALGSGSTSARLRNPTVATIDGTEYEYSIPSQLPASPITVDAGELVGEITPNTVWAYITFPFYETNADALIDAYVEALRQCVDDQFLLEVEARNAEVREAALRVYVEQIYNRQLNTYRERINEAQSYINQARNTVAVQVRTMIDNQRLLDALLTMQGNDGGAQLLREWELLKEHPRVQLLTFKEDEQSLVIRTTDDIRLTRSDTGESRWLGAFRITVNLQTFNIQIRNLNTRRGGRDHPHVSDGEPCFGGHDTSMYELLGRGELYTVFELLLQYLETLNLADEWGRYGSYWFDVPDERPLEVAEAVTA